MKDKGIRMKVDLLSRFLPPTTPTLTYPTYLSKSEKVKR